MTKLRNLAFYKLDGSEWLGSETVHVRDLCNASSGTNVDSRAKYIYDDGNTEFRMINWSYQDKEAIDESIKIPYDQKLTRNKLEKIVDTFNQPKQPKIYQIKEYK